MPVEHLRDSRFRLLQCNSQKPKLVLIEYKV